MYFCGPAIGKYASVALYTESHILVNTCRPYRLGKGK